MKKILLCLFVVSLVEVPLVAEGYGCSKNSRESYFNPSCSQRLKFGAEWLYWKAEQSQMEVASNVSSVNSVVDASNITPEFEYLNGYRFYVDYLLDGNWVVGTAFTHLPSQSSTSASNDPASLATNFIPLNDSLYPLFTAFSQQEIFLSSLDVQWDMDLYYLDSYIRRTFCFCQCVTVDPYVGLRGFWMKQTMRVNGDSPNSVVGDFSLTANFSEKFYGAGLLAGVDVSWQLRSALSLIGKFGSSLIYSSTKNDFNIQSNIVQILNKSRYKKAHPSLDCFIGIRYFKSFCKFSAEAHIGWENHLFLHTNQFSLTANGNLSAQGLTLGGSLTF